MQSEHRQYQNPSHGSLQNEMKVVGRTENEAKELLERVDEEALEVHICFEKNDEIVKYVR